jgi:hypothetical protein
MSVCFLLQALFHVLFSLLMHNRQWYGASAWNPKAVLVAYGGQPLTVFGDCLYRNPVDFI